MKLPKTFLLFAVLALPEVNAMAQKYNLLIGTYTNGKSEGIYVHSFDASTGKVRYLNKATGISNPSYLAISKDRKHVYAVNELGEGKGAVTALAFDPAQGALQVLNATSSKGDHPCYIAVDEDKQHAFVANYSGGNLSVLPIQKDGSLGEAIQTIQHIGSGPNKTRQAAPHVHMTILSPDGKYLLTNDLGTDKITVYSYDSPAEQPLTEASVYQGKPGSGPRHLTFHPKNSFAYVLNELSGGIEALSYQNRQLAPLQSVSHVDDYKGKTDAADIHLSPDGNFLYASYRGDLNELAIYSVAADGKLTFVEKQPSLGVGPRNFVIDPTGKFLLVAHQRSDDIVIFSRDQNTGKLTPLADQKIQVGSPVCLVFVEAD